MKNKLFSIALILLNNPILFAKRRMDRSYEIIGLPDGDEIGKSLTIAIPLLIIGFLIAYGFMWSKKDNEKVNNASTNIGCLGVIIMGIGFFFLLPLLAWFEFIFVSAYTIGLTIVILGVIIYVIYIVFKKK